MDTITNTISEGKDPVLWEVARKRVSFKYHLLTYVVMNIFFWSVWLLTGASYTHTGLPWPVWPAFGWGIGLLFHFIGAYVYPRSNMVQKEYEKIKKGGR